MNHARRFRPFSFVLLALSLTACATTVDDDMTSSSSTALNEASENLPTTPPVVRGDPSSAEVSIDAPGLDESKVAADARQAELASSSCRSACRCCANGNRFCCSHCRWCSGPIYVP